MLDLGFAERQIWENCGFRAKFIKIFAEWCWFIVDYSLYLQHKL